MQMVYRGVPHIVYHGTEKAFNKRRTYTYNMHTVAYFGSGFINTQDLGIRRYQILCIHPTYFLKQRNRPFPFENVHPSCQ